MLLSDGVVDLVVLGGLGRDKVSVVEVLIDSGRGEGESLKFA